MLSEMYSQIVWTSLSKWHQDIESSNHKLSEHHRLSCVTTPLPRHNETLCIRSDRTYVRLPHRQ